MDINVGERYTRLVVTERLSEQAGHRMWRCVCDCGRTCVARQDKLLAGRTKSCGCLYAERNVGAEESAEARAEALKILRETKRNLILANRLLTRNIKRRARLCGIEPLANPDYANFDQVGSPQQVAALLVNWAMLVHDILVTGSKEDSIRITASLSRLDVND